MFIFWLLTWLTLSSAFDFEEKNSGKFLLISMDGFRWDYLDNVETPNFDDFAKHGVKLPYMNNSFLTKTFPNHYTIVTGLYEESHGVIDNFMYDPVFNANFGMSTVESRWWNEGEPIWVTAKKQGLKTAVYYWPGSEAEIRGVRPDYWFKYSDSTSYLERVDTVIDWFINKNVSMACLYYPEPDHSGHGFGPDSPEVRAQVRRMDGVLGYLMQKMKDSDLENVVNVIVTSDHGMTRVDNVNRVVDITDHVDMKKVQRVPSYGPVLHIQPVEGETEAVFQSLSGVPHITVYKKEDLPERLHYKNNRRIMPIVIIAEEGWLITTNKTRQARSRTVATHGWDNALPSMKPIFLARGPDFKVNIVSDPIQNVDIYSLICKLLNIIPSANNGSLDRVQMMIKGYPGPTSASLPTGGPTAPSAGFAERHDLDCSAGVMHIHLPLSLFPTHSVTLRDPTCKVTSNGTHLVTDIGLNQCGTTVTFTNDSVIFNNDLLATASNNPGATVATIIDFGLNSADQRVPVSCIFPRESRLDFGYIPLQRTAHFYEKQYGHLDFEVRHYQTEQYRTLVPNTGLPVGVPLNTEVFIDLFVDQTNHKGVGIFVDSCIATPTTNPADPLWYPLVKDGCPMQADVRTFTTPDVNEFRFSFLAFKFTRAPLQKPAPSLPPSPMVYLHCQVSACPSGNCSTSCHSPSTRTRRSADQQKSHLISTGPFYLKTDDHDQEGYSTAVVVATMSVAAVATLVAMVAIVAWRRSANKLSKYRASTMDVTS